MRVSEASLSFQKAYSDRRPYNPGRAAGLCWRLQSDSSGGSDFRMRLNESDPHRNHQTDEETMKDKMVEIFKNI